MTQEIGALHAENTRVLAPGVALEDRGAIWRDAGANWTINLRAGRAELTTSATSIDKEIARVPDLAIHLERDAHAPRKPPERRRK